MAYISPFEEIQKIATKIKNKASGFVTKTVPNAYNTVVNTKFLPNQKYTVGQVLPKVTANLSQDFGNLIRGTSDLYGRPTKPANIPVVQNLRNMAGNMGQTFSSGIGDITRGVSNVAKGNYLQGGANILFGGAKALAPTTPTFMLGNIGTQIPQNQVQRFSGGVIKGQTGINNLAPEVKPKNVQLGPLQFDPVETAGSLIGFTKNPAWKKIFPITSQLLNVPGSNKLISFVVGRTFKGGIEGLIQGLNSIPENASKKQINQILLQNMGFGAGSEIGTDALFKSLGFVGNKTQMTKAFNKAVDIVSNEIRKANIPVREMDGTIRPMWMSVLRETLKDQRGFVDLDEIMGKPKPQGVIPPVEGGVISNPEGTYKPPLQEVKGKTVSPANIQEVGVSRQVAYSKPVSSEGSITQVQNPDNPYFNVNRINVPGNTKQVIKKAVEETKPQIEEVVGKKLSNKEVVDFANVSSKVLHSVVTRQQTKEYEAAILKTRELLAHQANEGTLTQEFIDNLIAVKSAGTDIARKLQSFSINANPQDITAKQAILEAILKVTDNADEILKQSKGVDFKDLNQATAFYRKFVKPKTSEWIDLLRYNSMLSSPNTHISNTSSNFQGTGLIAPIEKTILGGVDFLKSKITGSKREYLAGEGLEYAKGYYSSIGEAAHKFADVMSGRTLSENIDTRMLPLTTKNSKLRGLENTLRLPLTLLEAADQFFQTLTKGGVERQFKYKIGKGIKVENPEVKALKEAQKRLFRGDIGEKGQGILLDAMDEITNSVFKLRNSKNKLVSTIAKFTLPFVKTPMNILKSGVEYSPIGFANLIGNTNKTEQFTKALMGMTIGVGAANLLASDRLSWAEPVDENRRNEYRSAGIQPYSVRIGDTWVSYSKLHPLISMNLALVAALRDAEQNKKMTDSQINIVLNGLANWTQFFADQSYVKGIGDMITAAKGDVEGGGRIAANYVQQLVPFRALSGWITRILDPYQRKVNPDAGFVEKQLQQFMTQIPGLSTKVEPRLNYQGQPIETQHRFINALSPARISTQDPAKMMDYNEIQKLQKISKEAAYNRGLVKEEAVKLYGTLKNLDPNEAWDKLKQLKNVNPQLYNAVKNEAENTKYGLTYKEKKIKDLTVEDGTRAKYVVDEFKKLGTKEEKAALYSDWRKKKIITDQVAGQIKYLMSRGEL